MVPLADNYMDQNSVQRTLIDAGWMWQLFDNSNHGRLRWGIPEAIKKGN